MNIIRYLINNEPLILLIANNHYSDLLFKWAKTGYTDVFKNWYIDVFNTIVKNFTILVISNINKMDATSEKTALMTAAENDRTEMAELLLSHPLIQLDKITKDSKRTALMLLYPVNKSYCNSEAAP